MAFTQVVITQDFTLADGTEPGGSVTFTPNAPMLDAGVVIPPVPVTARLNGVGTISTTLVANTDPGTTPAGTAYKVDENINGVRRSYYIQVPYNQGSSLTLYDLAQISQPPGLSFPAGGGGGSVNSVSAGDSTMTIGGTATNPTVAATVGTSAGTVAAGDDSRFSLSSASSANRSLLFSLVFGG